MLGGAELGGITSGTVVLGRFIIRGTYWVIIPHDSPISIVAVTKAKIKIKKI